jgi:hypothetical protein
MEILGTPPKGDITHILAHQLIAAKLNVASGADDPSISQPISEADAWITDYPLGSDPGGAIREEGIELVQTLDAFNLGGGSSPACPDESPPNDSENDSPQNEGDANSDTDDDLAGGDTEEDEESVCALPLEAEYWSTHLDLWPTDTVTVGGTAYSPQEAMGLLGQSPEGEAVYDLIRQLIAAKLNQLLLGTDGEIADSIQAADEWLAAHPIGSIPDDEANEEGLSLGTSLKAYNDGEVELGQCVPESETEPPPAETEVDQDTADS